MSAKQHGGKRDGAGRPSANPEGRTEMITVRIPETLVAQLGELACKEGWNRSQAITEAVRRLVKAKRKA